MPLLCDSCKLENSNFPDFEQNRTEHHKLQFKFPYEITGIAKIIMFLKMRPLQVTKKIDKNHATYIRSGKIHFTRPNLHTSSNT